MRISILLAHPKADSFNHAIANAIAGSLRARGDEVVLHDLYAENFDPHLPAPELDRTENLPPEIRKHIDEILSADGIVVVHPNWWAMPPAILKGWVDRVLRAGVAYTFRANAQGEGEVVGLLKARTALVINTSNTPLEKDRALYGDPLDNLWRTCIFGFCGVKDVRRELYAPVIISTPEERQAWLNQAVDAALELFVRS
jgi:putative NADPH-quinone reductase